MLNFNLYKIQIHLIIFQRKNKVLRHIRYHFFGFSPHSYLKIIIFLDLWTKFKPRVTYSSVTIGHNITLFFFYTHTHTHTYVYVCIYIQYIYILLQR